MFVRRAGGLATSIHLQPTKIETTSYGGYTGKKTPSQSERLSRQTLTKYTERERGRGIDRICQVQKLPKTGVFTTISKTTSRKSYTYTRKSKSTVAKLNFSPLGLLVKATG